jgi:hypothetical protein
MPLSSSSWSKKLPLTYQSWLDGVEGIPRHFPNGGINVRVALDKQLDKVKVALDDGKMKRCLILRDWGMHQSSKLTETGEDWRRLAKKTSECWLVA